MNYLPLVVTDASPMPYGFGTGHPTKIAAYRDWRDNHCVGRLVGYAILNERHERVRVEMLRGETPKGSA